MVSTVIQLGANCVCLLLCAEPGRIAMFILSGPGGLLKAESCQLPDLFDMGDSSLDIKKSKH